MRRVGVGMALVGMLALGGCQSGDVAGPEPTAQMNLDQRGDSLGGAGPASVRGEISSPSGTGRRVVWIRAEQKANGEVKGSYRIELTASGTFFEVKASCVVTEGNVAWVGGHISATNSAAIQIGSVSYFYLIDNGKTRRGQPTQDVISSARINDQAGRDIEFCTTRPLQLPALTGLLGDVQVK